MIGAARVVGSQFQVEQFFLRNPAEEKAQLAALASFVDGASAIVSYNGKSFDLPIINTRYVLNRIKNPFLDFEHFDLLHIARRVWRRRLKQCNLGNIEKEILGFFRSGVDIPGYLVPEFYRDYLLRGDTSKIPGIFITMRTMSLVCSRSLIFFQKFWKIPALSIFPTRRTGFQSVN